LLRTFQPIVAQPPAPATGAAAWVSHFLTLLILFAWLAALAWVRPLSLPDEGRYVGVAWEMLWSGNWLVPTLDTLPYFHKPPLFYWGTAAALAAFGVNEWAARLVSLLAATGSAFALYVFMLRWNAPTARASLLVLATTPFFFGGAQFANMDMLVAACVTCCILCAADAVLAAENGRPRRLTLAASYVFAALGVLAKGLVGVALPVLVIGVWLLLSARPGMLLRLIWLPGLALFSLIALPWFVLMQMRYPEFLDYFFVNQHFQRYLTQGFNNPRPFWFYVPIFLLATVPWIGFVLATARDRDGSQMTRRDVSLLMWTWLAVTLVFFSIPASKLIGYVLPAVPAFAVLVAHGVMRSAKENSSPFLSAPFFALTAALICVALTIGFAIRERDGIGQLAKQIRPQLSTGDAIIALRMYPFSVPFYLHRQGTIGVVEDWDQAWVLRKDTWRKELYDAVGFDPARGKKLLITPRELEAALCSERTVWLFGPSDAVASLPIVGSLERVAHNRGGAVWRRPGNSRC
jgi:4-amino-4-deoxy-L-arabinose transferase-like glycosyltransferase